MVYDLNDDSEAAKVGAVGEEDNAANLDVSPGGGVDLDFGHCDCADWRWIRIVVKTITAAKECTIWTVYAPKVTIVCPGFDDLEIEA